MARAMTLLRSPFSACAFLACAVLALGACGPVGYISGVTVDASSEVASARAAQAEKYAPYEYTLAVEYLHKAREEAGYADFQAANRFGRFAKKQAKLAREKALKLAGQRELPAGEAPIDPSSVAPVEDKK